MLVVSEKKAFFRWLQHEGHTWETISFFAKKVFSRVIHQINGHYGNYHYPIKISELSELVQKSAICSCDNGSMVGVYEDDQNSPQRIQVASCEIKVPGGQMPWNSDFADPENEESLHRWNWLLYEASVESLSQGRLAWLGAMQEDWMKTFQHEIDLPRKRLHRLLRWEPYTIGERISNSILLFHLHNFTPKPVVQQGIVDQAIMLSSRLEYFGPLTGNHVCNNARGLYLAGAYFRNEALCVLAREILSLELPKLVTKDGFLREGSSHYQFLFTRWMIEVLYFASWSGDEKLSSFLEPFVHKLLRQCEFFLVESPTKEEQLPLFGDISPDFPPSWLLEMPEFINGGYREDQISQKKSWQMLWGKGLDSLVEFKRTCATKKSESPIQVYPESGWFRFEYSPFILFIRADKIGFTDYVGHHHQDAGHFCLFHQGVPLLVDGGRLNYFDPFGLHPESHNILTVDGFGSIPHKPKRFPRKYANCEQSLVHELQADTLMIRFTTDGFSRLSPKLIWSREWLLHQNGLEIVDTLDGSGEIYLNLFFHFASDIWIRENASLWEGKCNGLPFQFAPEPCCSSSLYFGGDSQLGWQVLEYGKRVPAPTLELKTSVCAPVTLQSSLRFT